LVCPWSFSRAASRLGSTSLTPCADSLDMTALAQSSVPSLTNWFASSRSRYVALPSGRSSPRPRRASPPGPSGRRN
jgi:hypothetical protein